MSISNGLIIPGSEQFYPILYNDYDSLLNYLGEYYFFGKNLLIIIKITIMI